MDRLLALGFKPVEVTLRKVIEEAPAVKSFYFDYVRNGFQYKASQVVHLHLDVESNPDMYHTFSIASSPTEDFLLFTMTMRPESFYKQRFNQLKPGDRLVVLGPVGKFTLPENPSQQVVMLGGGIGITPFRSMIKFATDMQLPHRITLLYSNMTSRDIVYRQEWKELERRNPNLRIVHTMTRPQESGGEWKGRIGRIDEALIREYIEDMNNVIFYLCGPPSMVRGLVDLLRAMNLDTRRIMVEAFMGYD